MTTKKKPKKTTQMKTMVTMQVTIKRGTQRFTLLTALLQVHPSLFLFVARTRRLIGIGCLRSMLSRRHRKKMDATKHVGDRGYVGFVLSFPGMDGNVPPMTSWKHWTTQSEA